MKPRRKQRQARAHAGLWTVLVVAVGIAAATYGCYLGLMGLVDEWCSDLPDVRSTDAFELPEESTIYASDGTTVLAEMFLENREPVTIDQVSPYVLKGTVATEDERFYEHNGVDLQGIIRAVFVNLAGGQEGASTITQQYVRNTIIADEMTDISLKRKVREITLAVELEKVYTKDEILMMYLNTINYGDGCYGIEAAAEHYFSTTADNLTIAQAATLIGIPNSPTMYNPVMYPDASTERRNVVLQRMLSNNVITQEEYNAAVAEPLTLNVMPEAGNNGVYLYPWFTTYVRDLLQTQQYQDLGISHDDLFEGGLQIVTTIDPQMQSYAEEAVAEEYEGYLADPNQEFALTLVDPNTGYIKAMIGGKDFNTDQFNVATSSTGRMMGSTAKAFTLTDAIEKGISPQTMMNCGSSVKVGEGAYAAEIYNYGKQSYGTLSIANMTAVSSNTGYVRLSYVDSDKSGVTPESIVAMQKRLGLNENNLPAVATTTLGVGSANTTEMAAAYGTFATGGVYREPTPIITITDRKGQVIVDNSNVEGKQLVDESVAYAVTQVLEGVIYSSMGTAGAAALPSGQIAAGKTGTTDDWHDLWFVGYTPQLSCAVWTGDRNNQAELETNTWCQDIWRKLMSKCLEGAELEEFKTAPAPPYDSAYTGSTNNDKDDEDEDKDEEEKDADSQNGSSTSNPSDPSSPTDPSDPSSPTDPSAPGEPTDPAGPSDPGSGGGTDPGTGASISRLRDGGAATSATPRPTAFSATLLARWLPAVWPFG